MFFDIVNPCPLSPFGGGRDGVDKVGWHTLYRSSVLSGSDRFSAGGTVGVAPNRLCVIVVLFVCGVKWAKAPSGWLQPWHSWHSWHSCPSGRPMLRRTNRRDRFPSVQG